MRLKILLLGGSTTPGFVIERSCGEFQLEILRPAKTELLFVEPAPHLAIVTLSESNPFEDLNWLSRLRTRQRGIPVIAIAVRSSEALAIAAFRAGCRDYLQYPYSQDDLAGAIQRCVSDGLRANGKVAIEQGGDAGTGRLIGNSPAMQRLRNYVSNIAPKASTVLITGETGTGKEVVAQLLHRNGADPGRPFVSVNCAAIPESLIESELFGHERGSFTGAAQAALGKLQLAGNGTIFLDEIGDMSAYAQAKILRAIENRQAYRVGGRASYPVLCRFVAATNCDLERNVTEGRFRKDLYYRLNVARIQLPALRERTSDIPELCSHFIAEMNRDFQGDVASCEEEVMRALLRYEWPGNIRELRNVFEAAYLNSPGRQLSMADMPDWFIQNLQRSEIRPPTELDRVLSALTSTNWNKSKAAEALHWSRTTLYRKIAHYQIGASR
jgi:DNA-binding NtrC family response regulator